MRAELEAMCRSEPEWACSQIRHLRAEVEKAQKERDEARREAEAMRRLASRLAYGGSLFGAVFQPSSFPWEKEE